MRFFWILFLLTSGLSSVHGQSSVDFVVMKLQLKEPLNELKARAGDSIRYYRGQMTAIKQEAQRLMGDDRLGKNAFAYANPKVYLERFGQDTGRVVSNAVAQWHQYHRRYLRWGHVAGRVANLAGKTGQQELYDRYGAKVVDMLKNEKKRTEILARELVRNAVFFHEWSEPSLSSGGFGYFSNAKIKESVKEFRPKTQVAASSPTVTAGGSIRAEDIYFSYPQNQQANFYPFEYIRGKGQVSLRTYPEEGLRKASAAKQLWARWKSAKGEVLYTRAVVNGRTIAYRIPTYFLEQREVYQLSIVKSDAEVFNKFLDFYAQRDIGDIIVRDVFHREKKEIIPEQEYFKAYFRVSNYGSFFAKTLSHDFVRVDGPGTVYRITTQEPFGPEEIEGLHGNEPQTNISVFGCRTVEKLIGRLYGNAAKTFYAHPRQEYVDYLTRNRDSLNIDSLVAQEFLPIKERSRKYRYLRYENAEGKRVSAFSKKLPLGKKPDHRSCIYITGETQPITEAVFNGTEAYLTEERSYLLRDTFAEAAQRIALEVAPLLEARTEEYAEVLRKLNELAPQNTGGKDFRELVAALHAPYLTDPRSEQQVGLYTCFRDKVSAGYALPLRSVNTTSSSFTVTGPE